jgi:hypothetical protein
LFQKTSSIPVGGQQGLDPRTQLLVVAARLVEKRGAFFGRLDINCRHKNLTFVHESHRTRLGPESSPHSTVRRSRPNLAKNFEE